MPRQCSVCEKKYLSVWRRKKLRSRYNPTVKRRQKPNLQWTKLSCLPAGERILACVKCIKTLAKNKK